MNRRRQLIRLAALAAPILSGAVVATALIMRPPSMQAATVTIGGPFTLTAADGTTVTDQTYRGKWLLVYFGYTYCPDTCPTALLEITIALEKLGPDAAMLQPLFITVDPQRDTVQVLGEYMQSFDPRIVGLTGTAQQIAAAAQEYGAYYVPHKNGSGAGDYAVDHSTYLYLMDPTGKFVRGFDADTPGRRIASTVRELMTQSPQRQSHEGSPHRLTE